VWRAALIVGLLSLAVPVAARAQAPCVCQLWAIQFTKHPTLRHTYDRSWRATAGRKREGARKKTKTQIYDWPKEGTFKESWCKRNPRLCKALKACMAAVAITEMQGPALGLSWWKTQIAASGACAQAAAGTLL
jgi:hypothetical protein